MKKNVLDQVVIRREPYFDPVVSTKNSRCSTYALVDIVNIDDDSATGEEETNHDLAMIKGSGQGNHFFVNANIVGNTDTRRVSAVKRPRT